MSAESVALRFQRSVNGRNWYKATPFIVVHVLGIFGLIEGLIEGAPAKVWWLCFWLYWIRMFFVTGFFHRFFSHRSFHASRPVQFIMALLTTTTVQKGALWWASHHRDHHVNSDQPADPHSVVQDGFWWAHVDWILSGIYDETDLERIGDLKKPELLWLNKYCQIMPVLMGIVITWWGGWQALFIGFFFSTVLLWHFTFSINSLAHVEIPWWFGPLASWKAYKTDPQDSSQNNFFLAFMTMGEGWHNPHHAEKHVTKQGDKWWMIDKTYYLLWLISRTRVISRVTCHSSRLQSRRLTA